MLLKIFIFVLCMKMYKIGRMEDDIGRWRFEVKEWKIRNKFNKGKYFGDR